MKKYIDKLKEIGTIVELNIGEIMTDDKASEIYQLTGELIYMVKDYNKKVKNQLSPLKNIIALIEACHLKGDDEISDIIQEDLEEAKISIKNLSDGV